MSQCPKLILPDDLPEETARLQKEARQKRVLEKSGKRKASSFLTSQEQQKAEEGERKDTLSETLASIFVLDQFYPPLFHRPVTGDGLCFYYALYDQLYGSLPTVHQVHAFKKTFFDWLFKWIRCMSPGVREQTIRDLFKLWDVPDATLEQLQERFEQYLDQKSKNSTDSRTFVDQNILSLMATYLQTPLHIYSLSHRDSKSTLSIACQPPIQALHSSFCFKRPPHLAQLVEKHAILLVHFVLERIVGDSVYDLEHYDSISPDPKHTNTKEQVLVDLLDLQKMYAAYPAGITRISPKCDVPIKGMERPFSKRLRMYQASEEEDEEEETNSCRGDKAKRSAALEAEWEEKVKSVVWRPNALVKPADLKLLWMPDTRINDAVIYAFCRMWSMEWNRICPSTRHSLLLVNDTMMYTFVSSRSDEEWEALIKLESSDPRVADALSKPLGVLAQAIEHSTQPWATSPFQFNEWLVPVFIPSNNHFVLLHLNFLDRICFVYDPLPPERQDADANSAVCTTLLFFALTLFQKYMRDMAAAFPNWKGQQAYKREGCGPQILDRLDAEKWSFYKPSTKHKMVPSQTNGDDCGVFVLKYIETLCKNLDSDTCVFDWSAAEIGQIRRSIATRLFALSTRPNKSE